MGKRFIPSAMDSNVKFIDILASAVQLPFRKLPLVKFYYISNKNTY